ncbi:MAG: hypothetical protein H6551_03215 [Chitinophagales bacterium]|nr:hypothetical protein [Chitinophagaceae bacterium]MCB9064134.1 hypothetical protein [Chitinophagales bacterium]
MKWLLVITGVITGVVVCFARLALMGWLYLFGLLSVMIFGALQILMIVQIVKYYDKVSKTGRLSALLAVNLFALIFLFQFDFGDTPGVFYVYEIFIGETESRFEDNAFIIAMLSAVAYIINFIIWRISVRRSRKQQQLTPGA